MRLRPVPRCQAPAVSCVQTSVRRAWPSPVAGGSSGRGSVRRPSACRVRALGAQRRLGREPAVVGGWRVRAWTGPVQGGLPSPQQSCHPPRAPARGDPGARKAGALPPSHHGPQALPQGRTGEPALRQEERSSACTGPAEKPGWHGLCAEQGARRAGRRLLRPVTPVRVNTSDRPAVCAGCLLKPGCVCPEHFSSAHRDWQGHGRTDRRPPTPPPARGPRTRPTPGLGEQAAARAPRAPLLLLSWLRQPGGR